MMHPVLWLRNTLHSGLRKTMLGKVLRELTSKPVRGVIHFVSATRMNEDDFWRTSALGQSLQKLKTAPDVQVHIHFNNTAGLPALYNQHISAVSRSDILVFLHDDLWLDDPDCINQIRKAVGYYDIVGVAGNIRLLPNQPIWCFKEPVNGQFVWDTGYLSGAIGDGRNSTKKIDTYGPTPMDCKVVDGVFIAVRGSNLKRSGTKFDERFKFHFYDVDFCRAANNSGLSIGTWPIAMTHQSGGAFLSPPWQDAYKIYVEKWSNRE